MFKDAGRNARVLEPLTAIIGDIVQPVEDIRDTTPDLTFERPRHGWVFQNAPPKSAVTSSKLSTLSPNAKPPLLEFEDMTLERGGKLLTWVRNAVKGIPL